MPKVFITYPTHIVDFSGYLQRCPFCGLNPVVLDMTDPDDGRPNYRVTCHNENCSVLVATPWSEKLDLVIGSWNRRVPDAIVDDVVRPKSEADRDKDQHPEGVLQQEVQPANRVA